MPRFFTTEIGDLARQLTLSPRRLRMEQLRGIDTLLGLIDPDRAYPYDFVCYHITKYRKRSDMPDFSISGKALICDLCTMAELLSRRAGLATAELGEPFETHQELSARLNVSTKTVRRWRNRGLMGLRITFDDGVNRLAFCRSTVDRFVAKYGNLVDKASSFRQLSLQERDGIIRRAKEVLARKQMKLHAVAKVIAAETGRAVETVRYTLRRYASSTEGSGLFERTSSALSCERWAGMWKCHVAGEPVERIAAAFGTTDDEVAQILRRVQLEQWRESPPAYIPNELFDAPNADALILDVAEPVVQGAEPQSIPKDVPAYLQALYRTPLLTAAQEQDLFRRYNYLKYKTAKALRAMKPERVTGEQMDQIRGWMTAFEEMKQRITRANLRLVVSIAKKHVGWVPEFYEIISDGNMSLMRAVEKFDYSRGTKFSTYATWAIVKNYARSIPEDHYHAKRYVTGQAELLEEAPDAREEAELESDRSKVRELLAAGLRELPEREREILSHHYGLSTGGVLMTLEQLGRRFGVTKERVRQIELQALARMRELLSPSLANA